MTTGQVAFVVFGLASQALLVAFFAARRWWPSRADVFGRASYGFGALGLPLALLLVAGPSPAMCIGPLLVAVWAVLGMIVDVWRPRPWRGPPAQWTVLGPYLAIYFFAQMFMWWPLWNLARAAWVLFTVLFAANTALNIQGHRRPDARET